jgi:metallo-beta-lactamase family protein
MKIGFYGAAGEVTGSCYLVTTSRARVLIDCGIFQGSATDMVRNARPPGFDHRSLDAVVVTHAHMDHTGRLPLLSKHGMRCPLYATRLTIALADLLLRDTAEIQKQDTMRRNRKRADRHCPPGRFCEPLYTEADVAKTIGAMRPIALNREVDVAPGVTARFVDSGHIIGSTSIVLRCRDDAAEKTIIFSGDVGHAGTPIIRDPIPPVICTQREGGRPDVVVLESTYGDRDHKPLEETFDELIAILHEARATGGKVLIPSFAVGRTQTLIYDLARWWHDGRIPKDLPVFIDSPLAIEATRLYEMDPTLFDEETRALRHVGQHPLRFPGLRFLRSGDESRMINNYAGPCVVIAGAGMATGGRIVHHLFNHLANPRTHVVIVGFQALNSLGRRLVERQPEVRINGQMIQVRAKVHTLGGLSAHAGRSELIRWAESTIGQATHAPGATAPRVILTHGEHGPRTALASALSTRLGIRCDLPRFGDEIDV